MALVTCPECKRSVSDRARACPTCGAPISTTHPRPLSPPSRPLEDNPQRHAAPQGESAGKQNAHEQSTRKTKLLVPIIITVVSLAAILGGLYLLNHEKPPSPGEVLTIPNDLERVVHLADSRYSGQITVRGVLSGGGGFGSGMIHKEMATGRSKVQAFGHDVKFIIRFSQSAYSGATQHWGSNWRGKVMTFTGQLDEPGGWNYALIVQNAEDVKME